MQTVTKTMPETNIHRGDEEIGGTQSHAHYHNVIISSFWIYREGFSNLNFLGMLLNFVDAILLINI